MSQDRKRNNPCTGVREEQPAREEKWRQTIFNAAWWGEPDLERAGTNQPKLDDATASQLQICGDSRDNNPS
jgi:hypothetical protein